MPSVIEYPGSYSKWKTLVSTKSLPAMKQELQSSRIEDCSHITNCNHLQNELNLLFILTLKCLKTV